MTDTIIAYRSTNTSRYHMTARNTAAYGVEVPSTVADGRNSLSLTKFVFLITNYIHEVFHKHKLSV